jgi:thioesterase domain-containing protein/acyl carrier protein
MSHIAQSRPGPDLWSAAGALLALQNQSAPLARVDFDSPPPLSFAQERLWTLEQNEPGAPYYHVPLTWKIRGKLAIAALEKSLNFLVQRHDILRTSFPESPEGPFQRINSWHLTLSRADLQAAGADAILREARQFVRAPFNLAAGPLLRAALYQREADDFWLVLVIHQMVFDGSSMRIFSIELAECYRAFSQGTTPQLDPLPLRYVDFAQWQRQSLEGDPLEQAVSFWRSQFEKRYEPLRLATDRPRRNEGVTPGNQLPFTLPLWVMTGLKHLAHDYGVTPFAALLGSFQAFLGLCAGQNDVLTLVSVAGRNQSPLRRMIGLFANILPMRLILSGVLNFGQLIECAGEMTSAALSNQQLPLNRTLELLPSSASHINAPALQSLMIYNNAPLPTLECPEVTFTPSLDLDNGTAKFDFSIEVWDSPQSLAGHFKYRSDLYEQVTMERLLQHWQTFIACGVANPFKPLGVLPLPFDPQATFQGANVPQISGFSVPALESRASTKIVEDQNPKLQIPQEFQAPNSNDLLSSKGAEGEDCRTQVQELNARNRSGNSISVGLGEGWGDGAYGYARPRNEVEQKLTRVWENTFDARPIGIHDNFFGLGGHSLTAVKLIAAIEKETGYRLRLSTIFQEPTIARLARAMHEGHASTNASSIVEIQPRGTKPPLFLVHGVGGGMFWGYSNLARQLGEEQPVYAFKSRGMDGLEEFTRIEDIASKYVADLRKFQTDGPYRLGGYCFGGNVAYEMARQLRAQEQEVELVLLINCWPNNSSYTQLSWTPVFLGKAVWNFCIRLAHQIRSGAKQPRDYFKWRAAWAVKRLRSLFSENISGRLSVDDIVDLSERPEQERKLWRTHVQAWIQYQPQPYDGGIVLFRTRGHPLVCSFDNQMGWGSFARGGVEVRICPGDHESILEEENVAHTARELAAILKELK